MIRRWRTGMKQANDNLRENASAYLTVHFFRRFFTGEMVSSEGDLQLGMGGIVALLALPGVFLSLLLLPKYSSFLRWLVGQPPFDFNTFSIPDKYMLLTLTMSITGIVAVLKWGSLFPDRLDYANLAPLPLKARSLFCAKFVALMLFVGLFILALNAASTVFFPLVVMESDATGPLFIRFVVAHFVACVAGSAFMFFLFFALAGLLMMFLPYRWFRKVSTVVQFTSFVSIVILLFLTPEIGSLAGGLARYPKPFLDWLPTVWFLGLYQQLFGAVDAQLHALALRALEALAVVIAASLALYAASYQRYFRRIPEATEPLAAGPTRLKRVVLHCFDRMALRKPFDRACFHFGMKTLARSPVHRLLLAGFIGLGVAIAIQDIATDGSAAIHAASHLPDATLLSAALALIFFLLSGLSFAFNVPAELPANWAFCVISEFRSEDAQRVAWKLMLVFLAPIIIATAAICSAAWGLRLGIAHTAFVLLASLLLGDVLFLGYQKIPFTCSYSAGKHNVGMVLAIYLLAFLFFSLGLAHLEHWALDSRSPIHFPALLALLAVALAGIRLYGGRLSTERGAPIFQDEPEPVVPSMNLR
jgi:hypothetical protein